MENLFVAAFCGQVLFFTELTALTSERILSLEETYTNVCKNERGKSK